MRTDIEQKSHRRRTLGCALAPVILIALVIGIRTLIGPWPSPPLWQVEKITGVQFPKSAKLLNSYGRWFMEVRIYAKVEIAPEDVQSFIDALPKDLDQPYAPGSRDPIFYASFPWWAETDNWWTEADRVRKYRIIQYETKESSVITQDRWFLIDLDDPRKAVIYVYYSNYDVS